MDRRSRALGDQLNSQGTKNEVSTKRKVEEIMKKSIITPEFYSQEKVSPYYQSAQAQRKKRREERAKTKGKDWFDLPATDVTDERKRDLEIMALRNTLDTKNFYRRDDRRVLPKYYQIGTVVEDATDFYSDRIPKKQRKQTIVDELLADNDFRKRQKEKYKEIIGKKKSIPHRGLKFRKQKSKNNNS